MLRHLQIGKIYHTKSYEQLVQDHIKYVKSFDWYHDPESFKIKARKIGNKTVKITGICTKCCQTKISYNINYISTYWTDKGFAIFPHELIEFDEPLINIF